jgi:hypothetical protein
MKHFRSGLWATLALVATVQSAHADQCAWVESSQSSAALRHLVPGQTWILRLCEPCGERLTPERRPELVLTAASAAREGGLQQVVVNGHNVDLAYVFVHVGNGQFANLAQLSGCPASDVSARVFVPNWSPGGQRPGISVRVQGSLRVQ